MHPLLQRLRCHAFLPLLGLLLANSSCLAADPGIASTRPADGSIWSTSIASFEATLINGDTAQVASASLKLDGISVNSQFVKTPDGAKVTYGPYSGFQGAAGATHTYTLLFTDTATPSVTRTQTVTFRIGYTPFGLNTFFIEAEDFNFSHGQTDTSNAVGMDAPYAGGTFQDLGDGLLGSACDGSDFGVDYFDNDSGSDQQVYRPYTSVEAGQRNGSSGVDRGYFDVQVNHVVGWSSAGEWMNYTRRFPDFPHEYKVYARMSHGDSSARRGGALYKVTSDPSICNQTVQKLGTFSAPWTGGWDQWPDTGTEQDALIPIKTPNGGAYVTLAGQTTLRWQFEEGGGDFDYLVFIDSNTIVDYFPQLDVIQPRGYPNSADPSGALELSFCCQDEFFYLVSASVFLDGRIVPAETTRDGAKTIFRYTPPTPFAVGSTHAYLINFTPSIGPVGAENYQFTVTHTPLPLGTLFIEAEDFNFGHGNTITDKPIGMTGSYAGGDFLDKGDGVAGAACDGSDFGIDFMDATSANEVAATDVNYRPHTPVEANQRNKSAGLNRGTFSVQVNHVIGWTDSSEWLNYTRTFPTNGLYKVYARMSHGQANARRGGKLFRVTGPADVCDQSLELLGSFSAPWTGGWDTWPDLGTDQDALIPMKNAAGDIAEISATGLQTLRFQFVEDAGDFDYLAFVPVPPKLSITASASGTAINFDGALEAAETLPGIFQPVLDATSPYTPPPSKEHWFFRAKR